MNLRSKVDGQPAYVLHTYPVSGNQPHRRSIFPRFRPHGPAGTWRPPPRAAIRGLLMAFQPLELGWAGKGEVLTLMKAEWQGGQPLALRRSLVLRLLPQ
jgi:DNA repair protein RecO (recombination protein O)